MKYFSVLVKYIGTLFLNGDGNVMVSGLGGLVVSMLAYSTGVRGFKPGGSPRIYFGRKNPQHVFLRKGSKAVYPIRRFAAC
jgi:hypothetical protein